MTASATSITFRNMAHVTFAEWRKAVDFAFIIAPQSNGVRVSQIKGEWVVEWRTLNSQPTYVPPTRYPYPSPSWQYPLVTNAN